MRLRTWRSRHKPLPTDLMILDAIYDRYYERFASFEKDNPDRESKALMPIDVVVIAGDLGVDPDIVFGRLHYQLDRKYSFETKAGAVQPSSLAFRSPSLWCLY